MADQIKIKEQVAALQKQLERKTLQMQSIQYIGQKLSSELRTEHLLIIIMDEVTKLMNAERSTFYIVDEERGELWSKIAQKAEIREIRLKIGVGIAGHVAKTGEIINIEDAYNDSRFNPDTDKKTGYRTRSILCMPIFEPLTSKRKKPKIIGVLQILNKIDGIFDKADEDLLSSLASQIAIAIINARLYSALEKKVNDINLLYDIEKELTKAYDLKELLSILVSRIKEALHVEAAMITLFKADLSGATDRVSINLNTEKVPLDSVKLNDGIPGEVIKTGKLFYTNEAKKIPLFNTLFSEQIGLDIQQIITAPLMINKNILGILEVYNKEDKEDIFREDDIRLINSLASQIARTIQAYRLRDEKVKADRLVSIGNMMSTIVHDLRTPMNNIYGFVDLMKEEAEEDVRSEYAEIIIEQIKSLTNMTTDILDFAKGKTSILPVKCPVDKLIDNFTKFFEKDIINRGYQYEASCDAKASVYVDPEKINRIFMNIMKNALEAMPKGGKFSIGANQVDGEIEFLLSDNGKGIPEEIRDKLFDSFVTSGKKG
ncbi:MAG: GAF domain-containing sensor histidine kinase, partial [Calditrichaceae bacterium]